MTVNPQEPGKTIGYRDQSEQALSIVNTIKTMENGFGDFIETMRRDFPELDERWVAIARTHLQQGFMALNRAVFRPESRL